MNTKKHEVDFTEGKMLKNIIAFALPVILSGWLQILFNVVDMVVVGQFVGDKALAAVGSTGPLVNLFVQLFVGLASGATIVVSQGFGARDMERMHNSAHTAMAISIFGGIILTVVGVLSAKPILVAMGSPADVIDMSVLYVQVYFAGVPFVLLYNFTSAIMRAYGDNKRPLYFMLLSGVLNVILNIVAVLVLHWSVAGVAVATFVSQGVAAFLNLACLMRIDNACRIDLKGIKLYKKEFLDILRYGIPAGIQNAAFSISNVLLQSALNSFGAITMAANGAMNYMGNILGQISSGFGIAATGVCAQNYGAKKKDRIFKGWKTSTVCSALTLLVFSVIVLAFMPLYLRLFTSEPETIEVGCKIANYHLIFWFLGGIMTASSCALRGIGYSVTSMIVTIFGTCVLRVVWVFTVFASLKSLIALFSCYPVTWFLTGLMHIIFFVYYWKRLDFSKA